mmetsp:Transcript_54156/g.100013  ORF Transcript_54156/g.100013 Transcript_54156/m.100013 type:complete len:445 (-) Transcript_54156:59-1393(-)
MAAAAPLVPVEEENVDTTEYLETLDMQADLYDAILVATFGGLGVVPLDDTEQQEGGDSGSGATGSSRLAPMKKTASTTKDSVDQQFKFRIHPVFVLVFLAWPLFSMQMTVLWCLFLDIDIAEPLKEDWEGLKNDPHMNLLFVVKCLMVVVLGNMSMLEFIHCIRPLCFALNPQTWKELKRPNSPLWSSPLGTISCAACCVIAELMQLQIAYTVLVLSMSITLRSSEITEVIFNSLAIIFITDLDEKSFEAASALFHFDMEAYGDLQDKGIPFEKDADPGPCGGVLSWRGGKANALSYMLAFLGVWVLYVRQLLMLYMAVQTQVLPIARDLCVIYEGLNHLNWRGYIWATCIEWSTFAIDFKKQVRYKMETGEGALGLPDKNGDVPCYTEQYNMMSFDNLAQLRWSLTNPLVYSIMLLTFLLVFYQLATFNQRRLKGVWGRVLGR